MYRKIIEDSIKSVTGFDNFAVEFPTEPSHGDYSTNVALLYAKEKAQSPRGYAEIVISQLNNDLNLKKIISKIEVAGPGFINFFLSEEALLNSLDDLGIYTAQKRRKIIVEYSSPNIAKKFSIGHFRSTVIGQAIYNLYKSIGHDVYGLNHIGDWGTQFGMILAEIEITNKNLEDISLDELEMMYTNFNSRLESEPDLKEKAKDWFKRLENGDELAKSRWQKIRDVSLADFEKTYKQLNIDIDEIRGESFYGGDGETQNKMSEIINTAIASGIAVEGEGGAKIVEFSDLPPAMLVKSDGSTTYFTRDLAAIKYRVENDLAETIIYEVGSEQILHFRQVFAAAKMFDWGKNVELIHVPHGLVRLESGKMSTRKGNTIKLEDIIQKAIDKSTDIKIAIGALKYNDLKRNPSGEIIFDWDEILSMEGNSGPYLQYSVVRANSVMQKVDKNVAQLSEIQNPKINNSERVLLAKLSRFDEVIFDAANNYSPSTLATYLYDLATEFNSFYNNNRIIDSSEQELRLAVTRKFSDVMTKGLEILGVQVPEKM